MFVLACIFLAIIIIGFIGNLLVILIILLNKQLHDSTNYLICNLAFADLLFLSFCVPITAYSYVYSWQFSKTVCLITVTLQYETCYVSVWTLVLLAYDRFISITNPAASRNLRRGTKVIGMSGLVWVIAFFLNLPQMKDVGVLTFYYNGTKGMSCVDSVSIASETETILNVRKFYWGFNMMAYLLPLAMSTCFYFLLVREMWKQKLVQSKSSEKMKRHATKMVFIVIITFGVCWFPQNMRYFIRGLNYPNLSFWEESTNLLLYVQSTAQVIAYANSCVNPILYGALSERFRTSMWITYRRYICCQKGFGQASNVYNPYIQRNSTSNCRQPSIQSQKVLGRADLMAIKENGKNESFRRKTVSDLCKHKKSVTNSLLNYELVVPNSNGNQKSVFKSNIANSSPEIFQYWDSSNQNTPKLSLKSRDEERMKIEECNVSIDSPTTDTEKKFSITSKTPFIRTPDQKHFAETIYYNDGEEEEDFVLL